MDKLFDVNRYKSGRTTLLIALILTIVNLLFMVFNGDYYFLYAMFVPQLAYMIATTELYSTVRLVVIFMFVVVPVLLMIICYLLSKNDYKWMKVAAVIMSVDTLVLAFFFFASGLSPDLVIDLIFEIVILYSLFNSAKIGKLLNNDFTVDENQKNTTSNSNVKVYSYDKELAKKNKTNRLGAYIGLFVGCMFLIVLAVILSIYVKSAVGQMLCFGITLVIVALFVFGAYRLSPYMDSFNTIFYKENNAVIKQSSQTMSGKLVMTNLIVLSENERSYLCSYISTTGKEKKITIPKCFKDIEEILY